MAVMKFLLMIQILSTVFSVRLQWGDNPDLVEESVIIQGREHIWLMVAMVGDSIDLECKVLFTRQPLGEIRWKSNGALVNQSGNPIVNTKDGVVFLKEHHKIDKVTENMDGRSVNCEYEKGQYVGRIEASLNIFKLVIETSRKFCETCTGKAKFIFKESIRSSQDETNVVRRIIFKITVMTNVKSDEITVENDEYSVILPIDTVKSNQAILAMKPKFVITGNPGQVDSAKENCKCGFLSPSLKSVDSDEPTKHGFISIGGILSLIIIILTVVIVKRAFFSRQQNKGSDNLNKPGFQACKKKGCKLCHKVWASVGKAVITEVVIHHTGMIQKCISEGTMKINQTITCENTNILYILTCTNKKCMKQVKQCIGETESSGDDMMRKIELECEDLQTNSAVGQHFQSANHSKDDLEFVVVETLLKHTERKKRMLDLSKKYKIRDNMDETEEKDMNEDHEIQLLPKV